MITVQEQRETQEWAVNAIRQAGIIVHDGNLGEVSVADFGLSRLNEIGAAILTLEANHWLALKVIALRPWQLLPQHRHPPCAAENYPGKTEILRAQGGEFYHYLPGAAALEPKARPTAMDRSHLTVWNEKVMRPGDLVTVTPNTWHWFQAGPQGAVLWSVSSKSTDAADEWSNPNIVRNTVVKG